METTLRRWFRDGGHVLLLSTAQPIGQEARSTPTMLWRNDCLDLKVD